MVLTVVVSRFLGPEALGLLTLGLTLVTIATIVACLGVDQGIIYFVARAQPVDAPAAPAVVEDRSEARPAAAAPAAPAAIRTALLVAAAGGLTVGGLAWLLAAPTAEVVFDSEQLAPILLVLVPAIPVAAVFSVALGALQGSFRVVHRAIIEWIASPLLTLGLAVVLLFAGRGVDGVVVAYLAAWSAMATVAVALVLRVRGATRPLIFGPLLALSLPLMLSLLTGYLLFHIDVLMLGALTSVREVGLYSAATRLALPLFLVLDSVARAFAPLAAHLYSQSRVDRLASVYAATTEWIMAINVPAGLLIVLLAEPLLALFGAEFVAATGALRVLAVGIVLATACGGAASVLTMTRWQRLEMADNLLLLLLNVILNLLLVPRFGALGAALATASSATTVYTLKVVQVRWLLSIHPFRLRQLSSAALAAASAALAWLATAPVDIDPTVKSGLRVVLFSAAYALLWWNWGCSAASREVLRNIGRRAR